MNVMPRLTRRALGLALTAGVVRPAVAAQRYLRGTYGGAGCTGLPEVQAFQRWLGGPVEIVDDFLQKDSWSGMIGEASWIGDCWKALPARRLALGVPMLVEEARPSLADGARGDFDGHFRDLAGRLVEKGYGTAFLRLGWEFNGDWYRWTARDDPADFAEFFRRVVTTMRAVAGAQFRFDWNPTIADGPTEKAYPGDAFVDVIGLDVYNQSWPALPAASLRWEYLLHHRAGLIWHREFAAKRGKPRSFPEWGTGTRPDGHGGGDDPAFVRNMLAWMQAGGPVAYACYWNYRADDYDAKVTDGKLPEAAAALRAGWSP